ncbi:MAG TPA: MATE family efflux transporter [Candidatus Babeliaceae bacterium]|nr:MATE family efflux transporter [Candidatus Babeliaceae bacterium]
MQAGISKGSKGERWGDILGYVWPEMLTAFITYALLNLVDAWLIADLKHTDSYVTLGVTNTLVHLIIKFAESLSIGVVVIAGQYNGAHEYPQAGRSAQAALWLTIAIAGILSLILIVFAPVLYSLYGITGGQGIIGAQFLRIRALGLACLFVYFTLVGFLRSSKNTKVPMALFVLGALVFICFDYALVKGVWGFFPLGLMGSAIASLLQYGTMLLGIILYLLFSKRYKPYKLDFKPLFSWQLSKELVWVSWPVMLDKMALAFAKMWIALQLAPLGTVALASFSAIKDLEQLAFVPAIATAQVITFLVSNDYAQNNWLRIEANLKRCVMLATLMVGILLGVLFWNPKPFLGLFDKTGSFTAFAARALPTLSILVIFDVLQLLLSAALRGAADVRTVMVVRLLTVIGFVVPFSYCVAHSGLESVMLKFIGIYGSFYIGDALMSIAYIGRLRGSRWKRQLHVT